jgi:hypothetical protein
MQCAYRIVIWILLCPRYSDTIANGTLFETQPLAAVCRRSWKLKSSSPAASTHGSNQWAVFSIGNLMSILYARNARGLTLQNVRFEMSEPDLRPAVIFDHVEDAAIYGLNVQGNAQAESVLRFIDSKQALLTGSRVLTASKPFLQLEGEGNDGIIVEGGDLSKASSAVAFKNGASEQAVKLRNVT